MGISVKPQDVVVSSGSQNARKWPGELTILLPRLASMRSTTMVRVVVRVAQFKIWLGSLFRPQEWHALSAFDFKPLLDAPEIDFPQAYAALKAAVAVAGRAHGEDISEYIVSKM